MPKQELVFEPPLMNAAGTLGFAPDPRAPVDWARLGAFVTHPISRAPRTPAGGPRLLEFPGGVLLHTGLPNPGLKSAIQRYGRRWARSPLPVIVHLLAQTPEELAGMVAAVEPLEGVMGVEVGLPLDGDAALVAALARAGRGELPLILRLPLDAAPALASAALDGGADAVSLGPPRGTLPKTPNQRVSGRLYGPAIFPLALRAVEKLSGLGIPIIGGGGVYQATEAETLLMAGAAAVQVDVALWRSRWG